MTVYNQKQILPNASWGISAQHPHVRSPCITIDLMESPSSPADLRYLYNHRYRQQESLFATGRQFPLCHHGNIHETPISNDYNVFKNRVFVNPILDPLAKEYALLHEQHIICYYYIYRCHENLLFLSEQVKRRNGQTLSERCCFYERRIIGLVFNAIRADWFWMLRYDSGLRYDPPGKHAVFPPSLPVPHDPDAIVYIIRGEKQLSFNEP